MYQRIVLGPEQTEPGNRGPSRGCFALQQAIKAQQPDWLTISSAGSLPDDAIPWFWLYTHGDMAIKCHEAGRPFIVGPNVLFSDCNRPGSTRAERIILNSPHCRLIFTDCDTGGWYERLIQDNLGPASGAKVVAIPYPVADPTEDELSLPVTDDVLLYLKSGCSEQLFRKLYDTYSCRVFRYGKYEREALIYAAFTCRACVYLADADRAPIAGAEMLLAGCPLVGTARGCPWTTQFSGQIASLTFDEICRAVDQRQGDDFRMERRITARDFFAPSARAKQYLNSCRSILDT